MVFPSTGVSATPRTSSPPITGPFCPRCRGLRAGRPRWNPVAATHGGFPENALQINRPARQRRLRLGLEPTYRRQPRPAVSKGQQHQDGRRTAHPSFPRAAEGVRAQQGHLRSAGPAAASVCSPWRTPNPTGARGFSFAMWRQRLANRQQDISLHDKIGHACPSSSGTFPGGLQPTSGACGELIRLTH